MMLTSEKQLQVAEVAEAIETAAGKVRALRDDEPNGSAGEHRRVVLWGVFSDLQEMRRRLLGAWSE